MFYEFGGFLGWLIIYCYIGTMLNYVMKVVNKRFGKKISQNASGKKVMSILMKIFVRNHRYFGFATVVFLLLHFTLQFTAFGFNVTGSIAAGLMILQVLIGMFGSYKHKKREGAWFVLHRTIAVLLVVGIAIHLLSPQLITKNSDNETQIQTQATENSTKVFTVEELSKYNGENGQPAYVAYQGTVYDVTDHPKWKNGEHNGHSAGTDLTNEILNSPHGDIVFNKLPIVGTLE